MHSFSSVGISGQTVATKCEYRCHLFAKAFDKVSHPKLPFKLESFCLSGDLLFKLTQMFSFKQKFVSTCVSVQCVNKCLNFMYNATSNYSCYL